MPLTIGSNIASLLAQRRLGQASSALETVFERLASGQRINRASDDAAGLAIADGLRADARIFTQANRNINDGLSLLNISSSALQELTGIVQRVQELAEQAANGGYSNKQREALDDEAQALGSEYRRILDTTEFNGIKILDGSVRSLSIQVGLDGSANSRIEINTGSPVLPSWDGTFTQIGTYPDSGRLRELFTDDFNGDGILDLIGLSDSGGGTNLFIGRGDGTFEAVQTFGNAGTGLLIGDVDNDGDIDFFNQSNGSYRIFLNNGTASFSNNVIGPDGSFAVGRTMTDINGDGNLDVALIRDDDSSYVLFGNGNGTFNAPVVQALGVADISRASFGDVNGDGKVDVVFGRNSSNNLYLALGNGDGTFGASTLFGTSPANEANPTLVDINGDSNLDLVIFGAFSASRVYSMLGNGDGTFQAAVTIGPENINSKISIYDLNADGHLDVIRANNGNGTVLTYLGNGDGSFQAGVVHSTTAAVAEKLAIGDFNRDGVPDIAVPAWTNDPVIILQGGADLRAVFPGISLRTQGNARTALDIMNSLGESLAFRLSEIGSSMSRLHAASSHVLSMREQTLRTESAIRDIDIAAEAANLLRLQIIQQAAASVLGQANAQPALVLKLLSTSREP